MRVETPTTTSPYSALVFDDIDWSEVGDHNPGRRSERYGASEVDVPTEWADEAGRDERRWVRSAGSSSGLTVKVTGYSPSAGFVVTVVVAPKDHPPTWRWWGATARRPTRPTRATTSMEGSEMPRAESMRETLAREAAEAEAAAAREDAEEQGARRSGQRARTCTPPASQVYSLRLPVEAIDTLRAVGDRLGEAPTALLRRFVLERLDQETRPARAEAKDPLETALAEMLPALRRRLDELAMAIEE